MHNFSNSKLNHTFSVVLHIPFATNELNFTWQENVWVSWASAQVNSNKMRKFDGSKFCIWL